MTDEVKEQITPSDNKLVWFSGADLPYSQNPTYIPKEVSFGLDSIIDQLQGFFHTALRGSPVSFQSCLGLKAILAALALALRVVEAKRSVVLS